MTEPIAVPESKDIWVAVAARAVPASPRQSFSTHRRAALGPRPDRSGAPPGVVLPKRSEWLPGRRRSPSISHPLVMFSGVPGPPRSTEAARIDPVSPPFAARPVASAAREVTAASKSRDIPRSRARFRLTTGLLRRM